MFVIADSDWFGDEAIKVPGNGVLALDVIHWLMGDEAFSGQTSTEADVQITHTRKQDVAWFYSTIFLAPALVIGAGVVGHPQRPAQAPPEQGRRKRGGRPHRRRRHPQRRRQEVRHDRARAGRSGRPRGRSASSPCTRPGSGSPSTRPAP